MKTPTERISLMNDSELLELYTESGHTDYFGELYSRYIPLVYGLCLRYLRSAEEAEDAVMQIFEELLPKVRRFYIKEFRTWLYSVAKNHCLQQLRKKKRETPADFNTFTANFLSNFTANFMESSDIAHLLSKRDNEAVLEALEKCIEKLPVPQKESIRFFFMEEKSYADISEITSYAVKSVKSYIQNGKRNLKLCIESQGIKYETA